MTQTVSHADLDDLFAADAIRDPYAFFGRLRETDPVHWNARYQLWIVTRHADVVDGFGRPQSLVRPPQGHL